MDDYKFKSIIQHHKNSSVNAGIENILDTQYRYFSSGISAPGRNFIGSIRYQF
nr:TonB-dependent receptor [Bacteroidota bacterium]